MGHLPATGPVLTARALPTPPEVPLERGEFTEVVLRGRLTALGGPGRLTARAERFLGRRLGTARWVLLTTRRLLVVAPFPREGDWFDVALDRREVRGAVPRKVGDLVLVDLSTPLGPQTLRLGSRSYDEAVRLVCSLRG